MAKTPAQLYHAHVEYFDNNIKNPVSYNSIIKRIKLGWSHDMIIQTPRSEKNVGIKFRDKISTNKNAKEITIADLYKDHVSFIYSKPTLDKPVGYSAFRNRIKNGRTIQKATETPRDDSRINRRYIFGIDPAEGSDIPAVTIMNPVEGIDYEYNDKHSNNVDLVATVIVILWLLYYFQNDIQYYIALLLS